MLFLTHGCSKNDDNFTPEEEVVIVPEEEVVEIDVTKDFIWKAMNLWYFWQEDVDNLSDSKFVDSQQGLKDYSDFLNAYDSPEDFFESGLRFSEDRFSYYDENYNNLTASFSGISKTNGVVFGLSRIGESDDVFGYVWYILPDTDASKKNIKRGDFFIGVNGERLTINNYIDLLYDDRDSYELNMAQIIDNVISENDITVELDKITNYQENPVFRSTVINASDKKIGYLIYNQFVRDFDADLYNELINLKNQNVTEVILDFRYNPGGFVSSAVNLSSIIYDTDTTKVFSRRRYNSKIQSLVGPNNLITNFSNNIDGNAITSLNLDKVYIITSSRSASASELVINCLAPYIDVVQVGETTTGKNEFSVTLVDDEENAYIFDNNREDAIKEGNSWAIQPLIGRTENSAGFFEYTTGLIPDFEITEDITNMGVLGDNNEPLLAYTIDIILGNSAKSNRINNYPAKPIADSNLKRVFNNAMIDDMN